MKEDRGFFIVYGDTRDHDPREVWREHATDERRSVPHRLVEEAPDFVLSTGDLVRCGANRAEWDRFDEENASFRERGIAYFPSLGNHDYLGEEKEALSNYFERFPALEGRKWYELRYRGLVILVLDSNEENLADYEKQLEVHWLEERIAKADADPSTKWIMLTSHHTAYTNAVLFSDSLWVQENFVARARRSKKFRAYLAGHVHSYERFRVDGVDFVVSGGGGAPLNDVKGKAGKHPDLYDGPRRFHYLKVSVGDEARVETVMLDEKGEWRTVDRFTFGK
jgi:3',5'-cyclic AMP phosphodiesterase CpdA